MNEINLISTYVFGCHSNISHAHSLHKKSLIALIDLAYMLNTHFEGKNKGLIELSIHDRMLK